MSRPVPVVLSAIFLGILSLFQLLAAAGMIFIAAFTLRKGLPGMGLSTTPLSPHFLSAMFFGMAIFYLAVAVWFILSLIALVRLRPWARYSILVIAGLMTAFAGMGTILSIAMPLLMSKSPGLQASPNPSVMHGVFLFIGAIYLIFTAIGVAQLIYFNRAGTRALFQQGDRITLAPPNTYTGRYRPTAITMISWLFMICSPFCLLYALLPVPAILFGFTLYGIAARAIYATFALIGFSVGYALYRLRPLAPVALIAWMVFGILNLLPFLSAWGQRNFAAYMEKFSPLYNTTPNPFLSTSFIAVCCILGLAFDAFILWLLYRHRQAFTPASPPPPISSSPLLDAPLPE